MRLLLKLAGIEAKLFLREPITVFFTFAFPLFMLVVLAGVFGNDIDVTDPDDVKAWRGVGPADYYAPAYVGLVIASVGLVALPLRLATYRERGVLRRFRAAGFPLSAVLGSQVVISIALVLIGSVAIAAAARIFYGAGLPDEWGGVVIAFALGVVCLACIGIALGAVLPGARAAQGAGLILFFVMMMLGGAGPPRGVLTDSMRWMSDTLPLTHVILTLQGPWLGDGWDAGAAVIVMAFSVAAAAVAWLFFRWE